MSAKAVIEAETEQEYIETRQQVRAQQEMTDHYFRLFPTSFGAPNEDKGQDIGWTAGSRKFERVDGVWYEIKRRKNPAYWSQANYFIIAPGPGKFAFIVVKMPRTLNTRLWRMACGQIYQDCVGKSWSNVTGARRWASDRHRAIVDGAEKDIYDRRVSGAKPEPAYEIFADGTWKRTGN